jgi:hypothetical protein
MKGSFSMRPPEKWRAENEILQRIAKREEYWLEKEINYLCERFFCKKTMPE